MFLFHSVGAALPLSLLKLTLFVCLILAIGCRKPQTEESFAEGGTLLPLLVKVFVASKGARENFCSRNGKDDHGVLGLFCDAP